MNLVADECCDVLLVSALRLDGHDVVSIQEIAPGSEDQIVLQLAASQQRILLTEDKDFGELVVRLQLPTHGIILLRINSANTALKLTRLRELFANHAERLPGSFVVVDESKTRFRLL